MVSFLDKMTVMSYNKICKIINLITVLSRKGEKLLPKKTFFNLPKNKKEKIIKAAKEEFGKKSFSEASVAGIIEEADIPRGSFYQYFSDLKDLYKYIMKQIMKKKINYFNNILQDMQNKNTFKLLKQLYRLGIKFAEENPLLTAIGNNFFQENSKFKEDIYEGFSRQTLNFYEEIIKKGIKRGEINKNINIEFTSLMLYHLNIFLADNFLENLDPENSPESMKNYLSNVDQMLYIIENGIKNRK